MIYETTLKHKETMMLNVTLLERFNYAPEDVLDLEDPTTNKKIGLTTPFSS